MSTYPEMHLRIARMRRALAAIELWGETQGQFHPIAAAEVGNAVSALRGFESGLRNIEAGEPSAAHTLANVIHDLRTAGRQPATGAAK